MKTLSENVSSIENLTSPSEVESIKSKDESSQVKSNSWFTIVENIIRVTRWSKNHDGTSWERILWLQNHAEIYDYNDSQPLTKYSSDQ